MDKIFGDETLVKNVDVPNTLKDSNKETTEVNKYNFFYDASKVKNNDSNTYGLPITNNSSSLKVSYGIGEDNKVVYVSMGLNNSKEIVFDKEVSEIYLSGIGLDVSGNKVIFLMKDGTVYYLNEYEAVNSGNYNNVSKIDNLENVVKFYTTTTRRKDSNLGSYYTILAQTSDGNLYDLNPMIGN